MNLVSLKQDDREALRRPVTKEELFKTIQSLQNSKAPGPDGYGPESYKKFAELVTDPLLRMYTESFERGYPPPTLYTANITLILKKDRLADQCGSYRPISLINADSKLLSKLLARRLEMLQPKIISTDLTGFIKK